MAAAELIAVPNFSEGAEHQAIEAITLAFGAEAELLDRHSDAVHNRTVLTLAGTAEELQRALLAGTEACIERIDMTTHAGAHPCVGALDVCPVVWPTPAGEAPAGELAQALAPAIGELGVPVFLYGALAADPLRAERAFIRRGGPAALGERLRSGELEPDFGPAALHPRAGATLVTARPPLAAFNVELDTSEVEVARAVAASLRESGGGLHGVRALGIELGERAQVSTNVHDPAAVPLGAVIERVRELAAAHGARPLSGEVVGLVPAAALRLLPADVPLRGFDPARQVIERRLGHDR
jgi:glutamate formiminotransferase